MSKYNVSTAWNAISRADIVQSLDELRELGFDGVELAWIDELKFKQIEKLTLKVASVHNYLPEPIILKADRWRGDVYRLTSLDAGERAEAVKATKRTIDTAVHFGAPAVVIHFGRPEGMPEKSDKLMELYKLGKRDSAEFEKIKEIIIRSREEKKVKNLELGLKSLDEINSYAFKRDAKLGMETRMYYEELPGLEEFELIFNKFRGGACCYWHDIGHAELHEKLGFLKASDYLDKFGDLLIGMHIHDCIGLDDHNAPGLGDTDFSKFAKYFKKDNVIKVFEVHNKSAKEQVIKAREDFESRF